VNTTAENHMTGT